LDIIVGVSRPETPSAPGKGNVFTKKKIGKTRPQNEWNSHNRLEIYNSTTRRKEGGGALRTAGERGKITSEKNTNH